MKTFIGHSEAETEAAGCEIAHMLPPDAVVHLIGDLGAGKTFLARAIAQVPGGAMVIGKSLDVLLDGFDRWDGKRAVGAIAGRLPFGPGLVFGALRMPHDGTVSVEETQLPGLTDHCLVPATHTGLLFSEEAAAQTVAFLRNKRFSRPG